MARLNCKNTLACVFALIWVLALAGLYWWYTSRYIRPFSEDTTVFFEAGVLRLPDEIAGPGRLRLVHFWDPPCPCNVGNQQHLAELIEHFGDRMDFYVWQKPGSQGRLPQGLQAMKRLDSLPGAEFMPASPAVAIWNAEGKLAYLGPYSEGAVCTSANSFIEPVIEALLAGRPVDSTAALALGCYCQWDETQPRP